MPDEILFIDGQTGQQESFSLPNSEKNPEIPLRQAGVAPALGQPPIPHILTFQGAIGGASRTYLPSDEALQHSWANAQHMRQDAAIMEPLEVRKRAVALLDWHLEPDDPEDPQQQEMAETVTWILRQIPRFYQYRETLLEALWYGRYAVVNTVRWKFRRGKPVLCVVAWRPLHGDKLVWRWDDQSGDYDPDSVGIRIGQHQSASYVQAWREWAERQGGQILPTHNGLAYFPPPHYRELLVIHRHMVEDGDFHSPENAARIFGVGIRSRIYWTWYQKQEALAWLMEYLERSAFGLELWYYPAGSEQAKKATIEAATERIGNARNILVIPRPVGPEGQMFGVEVIERNMAGAAAIKEIITEYFGHQIKRYILGQTLTTEAHATGLGSNLASIHLDTFLQIVKADAVNLQETLTTDLVARLVRWNWPWVAENPLRLVIETEKPDAEDRLRAIRMAYEMGLKIRGRDIRDLLGLAEPQKDEEILWAKEGADGKSDPFGLFEAKAEPPNGQGEPNSKKVQF